MAKDDFNIHGMKAYPLERIAIDPLTSLEQGLGTSLFSSGNNNVVIGRWPDIYKEWPTMPSPGEVWGQVTTAIMSNLVSYGAECVAKGVAQITIPSISDVLGEGVNEMQEYMMNTEEMIEWVSGGGAANIASGALQAGLGTAVSLCASKLTTWIGDLKNKWQDVQDEHQAWCDKLLPYICQGPSYVAQVAEQINNHGKKVIKHEVDKYVNRGVEHKKKVVAMLASSHAAKLAAKASADFMNTTREAFTKVDELKQKAQSDAQMVIKENVLEIAAQFGF